MAEALGDREKEIFCLIGKGLTTGAIAEQLFLNTRTIDTHREHIKRKLNISTANELSRLAFHTIPKNTLVLSSTIELINLALTARAFKERCASHFSKTLAW